MARVVKRLELADLQLLVSMQKDAEAHKLWEIDEDSARIFLSDPMNYFFACFDNDKAIGFVCGYELHRLDSTGNMLYIHGVGVHECFRRQGVGKQMITAVKQQCKFNGIQKMFLYTHQANIAACALYESTGGAAQRGDTVSYFFNHLTDAEY